MSRLKRLNPLAAVADQAWLSLLSLVIALAFIRGADKAEYGHYILLTTPLLLVQSIQNALVNSPLATLLPTAQADTLPQFTATAVSMHMAIGGVGAVLGTIGLYVYSLASGVQADPLLIGGFALAIMGTIAREAQRAFAYANQQGIRALQADLVYGVLLLAAIGMAVAGQTLTAAVTLAAIGLAGLTPLLPTLGHLHQLDAHAGSARQFWACGRWALPSVIATWISLNAYPYFASAQLGVAAVADIGAARLFLMPVGLVSTAWGNWYRPRISCWFAEKNLDAIRNTTKHSLMIGMAAMALIMLAVLIAYPLAEPLLGPQYQGLQNLVLVWSLYFTIALARSMFMATLMVDANGYRILHHVTWLALALALPAFMLISGWGTIWVVAVLCVIEALQLTAVMIKANTYWQRLRNGNA